MSELLFNSPHKAVQLSATADLSDTELLNLVYQSDNLFFATHCASLFTNRSRNHPIESIDLLVTKINSSVYRKNNALIIIDCIIDLLSIANEPFTRSSHPLIIILEEQPTHQIDILQCIYTSFSAVELLDVALHGELLDYIFVTLTYDAFKILFVNLIPIQKNLEYILNVQSTLLKQDATQLLVFAILDRISKERIAEASSNDILCVHILKTIMTLQQQSQPIFAYLEMLLDVAGRNLCESALMTLLVSVSDALCGEHTTRNEMNVLIRIILLVCERLGKGSDLVRQVICSSALPVFVYLSVSNDKDLKTKCMHLLARISRIYQEFQVVPLGAMSDTKSVLTVSSQQSSKFESFIRDLSLGASNFASASIVINLLFATTRLMLESEIQPPRLSKIAAHLQEKPGLHLPFISLYFFIAEHTSDPARRLSLIKSTHLLSSKDAFVTGTLVNFATQCINHRSIEVRTTGLDLLTHLAINQPRIWQILKPHIATHVSKMKKINVKKNGIGSIERVWGLSVLSVVCRMCEARVKEVGEDMLPWLFSLLGVYWGTKYTLECCYALRCVLTCVRGKIADARAVWGVCLKSVVENSELLAIDERLFALICGFFGLTGSNPDDSELSIAFKIEVLSTYMIPLLCQPVDDHTAHDTHLQSLKMSTAFFNAFSMFDYILYKDLLLSPTLLIQHLSLNVRSSDGLSCFIASLVKHEIEHTPRSLLRCSTLVNAQPQPSKNDTGTTQSMIMALHKDYEHERVSSRRAQLSTVLAWLPIKAASNAEMLVDQLSSDAPNLFNATFGLECTSTQKFTTFWKYILTLKVYQEKTSAILMRAAFDRISLSFYEKERDKLLSARTPRDTAHSIFSVTGLCRALSEVGGVDRSLVANLCELLINTGKCNTNTSVARAVILCVGELVVYVNDPLLLNTLTIFCVEKCTDNEDYIASTLCGILLSASQSELTKTSLDLVKIALNDLLTIDAGLNGFTFASRSNPELVPVLAPLLTNKLSHAMPRTSHSSFSESDLTKRIDPFANAAKADQIDICVEINGHLDANLEETSLNKIIAFAHSTLHLHTDIKLSTLIGTVLGRALLRKHAKHLSTMLYPAISRWSSCEYIDAPCVNAIQSVLNEGHGSYSHSASDAKDYSRLSTSTSYLRALFKCMSNESVDLSFISIVLKAFSSIGIVLPAVDWTLLLDRMLKSGEPHARSAAFLFVMSQCCRSYAAKCFAELFNKWFVVFMSNDDFKYVLREIHVELLKVLGIVQDKGYEMVFTESLRMEWVKQLMTRLQTVKIDQETSLSINHLTEALQGFMNAKRIATYT